MDETNVGILILAAGVSKRLGKPKQLVKFRGKTLLENSIEKALSLNAQEICVVLGAYANLFQSNIQDFPVTICVNKSWQDGMSSSIKFGLQTLLGKDKELDAVLIMLCDQPLIKSSQIEKLITKYKDSESKIVATRYNISNGVPAIFSRALFTRLLNIEGDKGARKILNAPANNIQTISIPNADFDVDTIEDVKKLKDFE